MTCVTSDADIYYTTDGSEPTTDSLIYYGPITLTNPTTIKAFAAYTGVADSEVAETAYTIVDANYSLELTAPAFDEVMVGYEQPEAKPLTIVNNGNMMSTITEVALSGDGADNFELNKTEGTTLAAGQTDSATYMIQPKTGLAAGIYTAILSVTYDSDEPAEAEISFMVRTEDQVAAPVFTPAPGTYTEALSVTISCATEEATICYTTDGTAPTAASSKYEGPISVTETTAIKAIAVRDGMTDSSVAEAVYTINKAPETSTVTVTLKVVNGAWGDGTKEDKTITLTGSEGDELRLAFAQIPEVNKPDEGYSAKTGSWDKEPSFILDGETYGDPITKDTVYTYTYGEEKKADEGEKSEDDKESDEDGNSEDDDKSEEDEKQSGNDKASDEDVNPDENQKSDEDGKSDEDQKSDEDVKPDEDEEADEDKKPDEDEEPDEDRKAEEDETTEEETPDESETEDPVSGFVKRLYRVMLGREADESGLQSWSVLLKGGMASAAQVVRGFACSEEFILNHQSNADIVRALYLAMLNREPDPVGLDAWANVLAENRPVEVVINGLAGSAEFGAICEEYNILSGAVAVPVVHPNSVKWDRIEAFVKRCYYVILGRLTDEEGLKGWSDALASGEAEASRIIEGFVCSDEFTNMHLSNEAIVRILYRAMLDRTADEEGLRGWTAALDQGYSLQHIINGFCGSEEFIRLCAEYGITPGSVAVGDTTVEREGIVPEGGEAAPVIVGEDQSEFINEEKIRAFVEHCYVSVFGREGDAEGIGNYTKAILDGKMTPESVAREFVFSAEFQEKLPGNEEFIRVLYRLYCGREPGAEELAGWVQTLEGGATPEEIVNGFAGSAEFKAIVNEMKN